MAATVYSLPTSLRTVGNYVWGYRNNVVVSPSPLTAEAKTLEIPGFRWLVDITYRVLTKEESADLKALLVKLRGRANRLQLFDFGTPAPRGTLRGTPVLSSAILYGDDQFQCTAGTGMTVKKGDMFGLYSGQLVMAVEDATESGGHITVHFGPPARAGVANGTAVTWDAPTANFVPVDDTVRWPVAPGERIEDFTMSFMEIW